MLLLPVVVVSYTFYNRPTITAIAPLFGHFTGGTTLFLDIASNVSASIVQTITHSNTTNATMHFTSAARCSIRGSTTAVTILNETLVTCATPYITYGAVVPVYLSLDGWNYFDTGHMFSSVDVNARVGTITPPIFVIGSESDVVLNISGSLFTNVTKCRYVLTYTSQANGSSVTATSVEVPSDFTSDEFIRCNVPHISEWAFVGDTSVELSVDVSLYLSVNQYDFYDTGAPVSRFLRLCSYFEFYG